jgi:iron complex outermembrane recepter protein
MALARSITALLGGASLALLAPAAYAAPDTNVVVGGGPLSSALHELARQSGIDLIFEEATVAGLSAPAVRGRMPPEVALERLLRGTGLTARRSGSGAFLIVPASGADASDGAEVPEILVIGTRTQNVDIRRQESDVQPYRVDTGERIVRAHRDNLDQYFRSRVTANTQVLPPSLLDNGETVSQINLRGLGADGTLILMDGRRLPGVPVPSEPLGFGQPDINAVPLHAIERVETITGTAGGIYGFGALGGVVNVVLERDYRGAELHVTAGLSSRGDARRLGIEGRFGFSPNDGRTEVMLYLSHARSEPLLRGERDYAVRDLSEAYRLAPGDVIAGFPPPELSAVGVFSFFSGQELVLKPEYGGAALGSDHTFLPAGFEGTSAELAQSLRTNAGQLDLALAEGEARTEIGSSPALTAGLFNLRHRFSQSLEGFVDALVLRNRGRHVERISHGSVFMFPDAPQNPFNQIITVTFPVEGREAERTVTVTTQRYTAGLIASLPFDWRGTAEATFGSVSYRTRFVDRQDYSDPFIFFLGLESDPDFTPFGSWSQFQAALAAYRVDAFSSGAERNRYREQSLRLAGPLLEAAGGPVTLTLLAERRQERIPGHLETLRSGSTVIEFDVAGRSSDSRSFYGELRAPLGSDSARFPLIRGLELQLAVRHDRLEAEFSSDPLRAASATVLRRPFRGTAFTAGAKSSPWRWLMLRGSYATGLQPPPLEGVIEEEEVSNFEFVFDPKRGDTFVGGPVLLRTGGSADLRNVRATTLSLGTILTPLGPGGPRLSLDYSRIRRVGDFFPFLGSQIVQNEDIFPERVMREPLTDEDRAQGYTAGRITMIDSRGVNGTRRRVDSVDARFEWPARLLGGTLRAYAVATYQMRHRERNVLGPSIELVDYRDGPLRWRANAGFDWTRGALAVGANLQYFGRYRVFNQDEAPAKEVITDLQGSDWVSDRAYVDLYASRRFRLGNGASAPELTVDFGIVNLFDASPPRQTTSSLLGPGFSLYGDPRRRRFELVLSSRF